MAFEIRQGDTSPPLREIVREPSGKPVDLTGATARFVMTSATAPGSGPPVVNGSAVVSDAQWGRVEYGWATSDTAEPGAYFGEFEITMADGRKRTHPQGRYLHIRIGRDLD